MAFLVRLSSKQSSKYSEECRRLYLLKDTMTGVASGGTEPGRSVTEDP